MHNPVVSLCSESNGFVVQWLERRDHNPHVVSSILTLAYKFIYCFFFF